MACHGRTSREDLPLVYRKGFEEGGLDGGIVAAGEGAGHLVPTFIYFGRSTITKQGYVLSSGGQGDGDKAVVKVKPHSRHLEVCLS